MCAFVGWNSNTRLSHLYITSYMNKTQSKHVTFHYFTIYTCRQLNLSLTQNTLRLQKGVKEVERLKTGQPTGMYVGGWGGVRGIGNTG